MAEQLGEASLRLTVDLEAFRQGLREARSLVQSELRGVQTSSRSAGDGGTANRRRLRQEEQIARNRQREIDRRARQGGPREDTRALEIAQEKRFRLARKIDTLEERGANVARLRARLGVLTDAQSQRQFGTFRQISRELARQVVLQERRQQSAERAAREERRLTDIGARQGGASESIFSLEKAQDRRFKISQRINRLEERGADATRLRTKLGELTTSYAQSQFGTARQLSRELERQLSLSEARFRREQELQRVLDRNARIGGPRSPIRGTAQLPGSPAFIESSARVGGARSPIGGSVLIPGSPAFNKEQERLIRIAEQKQLVELRNSARAGGARSPIGGSVLIPGSPAFNKAQQRLADQNTARAARAGGPSSPISGRLVDGSTIFGSPAFRKDAQKQYSKSLNELTRAQQKEARIRTSRIESARTRAGEAIGSGLIGGAFPALFGQGAGASAGGLIGGTIGGLFGGAGGFAGGLVGTLAGAQVDNLGNVAKALDQPIAKFKELQDAGLISSKALEKTIQSLISAGRVSEAEALIRQDVAKRGLDAATASRLSEESDRLKRALADLGVSFALVAQGPLTQFINLLNNALQPGAVAARSKEVQSQLSPKDRQAFLARREQLKAEGGMNIVDINKKLIGEFESRTVAAKKGAQDIAAAREKDSKFLSLNYKLISAQSQGQKKNALELEKQLVTEQKLRDLKLNPDQAGEIELKARMRLYELTEQQKQLEQDLLAQRLQQNVEAGIAAKNIQQRLADARQLAGVEAGVTRQAIQQGQEIRAGVQAARDRVTSIGAQIDALRIQGGDNGPQLSKLVDEQVVASEEVRLNLEKGATALRDAGKQLRDDLKAAKLTLADTVNDPNGLNKFLTPEQQGQRAQQQLQQLLPDFRIAQQQFTQRTGATAPEFTGSSTDVVSAVTDFIRRVDAEVNAGRDVNSIQQALAQNTADLVSINTQLATVVQELAGKNWLVNVNVPGGTASGDVVGALNGAL